MKVVDVKDAPDTKVQSYFAGALLTMTLIVSATSCGEKSDQQHPWQSSLRTNLSSSRHDDRVCPAHRRSILRPVSFLARNPRVSLAQDRALGREIEFEPF